VPIQVDDCAFFVGDHLGFDAATREALRDAMAVGVGPVSLHAEDAIVTVINELDRRCAVSSRPPA
jgi:tRNA pseudouridine-54 N-methylase